MDDLVMEAVGDARQVRVKRTGLGSSKVEGLHGPGAGFLIKGKAQFMTSGPDFDSMMEKFSWLRATLAVTIETATQTW